jgi:carbohydrate diacid regulator
METLLAEKIITEIKKFSDLRCAITDEFGTVLATSKQFDITHPQVNIKGSKAIALKHAGKKYGFLYLDELAAERSKYGNILKSIAEVVIQQARHADILTSDEKRLDQLTYDFLLTDTIDGNDYLNVLRSFGIDVHVNRTAIILEICDPEYLLLYGREILEGEREKIVARVKRSVESTLKTFYTQHAQNLVFYLGGTKFLILKDMGEDQPEYQEEFKKTLNSLHFNLKTELRIGITIGVGDFKEGTEGLKESFSEARAALKFGEQTWGVNRIYHYDNFGVVAPLFSGASQENVSFSKDIISKVNSHDLKQTLDCFLENDLSVGKTSKKLKVHRNTLIYRLDRIADITGLDPKIFNDAFQLRMALILDRHHD